MGWSLKGRRGEKVNAGGVGECEWRSGWVRGWVRAWVVAAQCRLKWDEYRRQQTAARGNQPSACCSVVAP